VVTKIDTLRNVRVQVSAQSGVFSCDSPDVTSDGLGYPGDLGGACTEAWATVKLWCQFGVDVHLIPTWGCDLRWRQRCDALGCTTHNATDQTLHQVPGLAGSVVVAFCNSAFLANAHRLRGLDCRLVFCNCMTWLFTRPIWTPWGWAMDRSRLAWLLANWCTGNPKCFTCKIKSAYRRTRRELFPVLSRIQNIGYDLGKNGRTPDWYRANHRTPWVAGRLAVGKFSCAVPIGA